MKRFALIFLSSLLMTNATVAQIEDKADYEADYDTDPQMPESEYTFNQSQNAPIKSHVEQNNETIEISNNIEEHTINMLGINYGTTYNEAEQLLFKRFGVKNEENIENTISYGEAGKEIYVYNSKWDNISWCFTPVEEGHKFYIGIMTEVFLSKEECEYNVNNFIKGIEKEFNINMERSFEIEENGIEKINYKGGNHPENGREAISVSYFGKDNLYIALVTFFPGIPKEYDMPLEEPKNTSPIQQQEHLKFMGFELNGTISEFHEKLISKGLTISKENKSLPIGQRSYDGIFSGHKAYIVIWYNPRTKTVYRAKAIIKRLGKDMIEQILSDIKTKMDAKYGTKNRTEESFTDDYTHTFTQYEYNLSNGTISLFISSTGYTNQNDFYLHIDYHDRQNEIQTKIEEMDDI